MFDRSELKGRSAFTLLEVLIVLVCIGIIIAVGMPRFSSAADNAQKRQTVTNAIELQKAVDRYVIEHEPYLLFHQSYSFEPDGPMILGLNPDSDGQTCLTHSTDHSGISSSGYGPYLQAIPANPLIGDNAVYWTVKYSARKIGMEISRESDSPPPDAVEGWVIRDPGDDDPTVGILTPDGDVLYGPDFQEPDEPKLPD